jgi:hypothetical protein
VFSQGFIEPIAPEAIKALIIAIYTKLGLW